MAAKQKLHESMTQALRDAIAASGFSFKAMERATGISRQSLMKFAAGEQSLRLESADKLASFFEIRVVSAKANNRKPK